MIYTIKAEKIATNVMYLTLISDDSRLDADIGVFCRLESNGEWCSFAEWRMLHFICLILGTTKNRLLVELYIRGSIKFDIKTIRTDVI